jgi:NADPH2:quinone reductase
MTTAIRVHTHGGPDELRLEDIELAEPGPGEVLVDVAAAGVNFIDIYHRSGQYPMPLPATLGMEGAGTVAAVGSEVSDLAVGDRVAWAFASGSYATQTLVSAAAAVPVPSRVDDRTAAAVMLQGLTAHYLVHSITPLHEGDTALVHAGAGGVGLLLTQMLVDHGLRVLSTVSSDEKADLSRDAGAEPIVGYEGFAETVREQTDGRGVKIVFDGVGKDTFDSSLESLAARGTMVLFGASSGPVPPFDPQILNRHGSLMLSRPSLAHFIATRDELEWRAREVFDLIGSGRLDVRIGAEFPLADAAEAHRALEGRRTTGKVLLIP